MKIKSMIATLVAVGGALVAGVSSAATVGNVTPHMINGSGVTNGSYTIATNGALEIGLRASLRYDSTGQPQAIYNYNSATDAYEFNPANSSASPSNRSIFNFDWSIDTDTGARGASAHTISSYTYVLGVDTDAGLGTNYLTFDPYAVRTTVPDHSFGYNTTLDGAGFRATDAANFALLKNTYNVSQQSVNMGFGLLASPRTPGLYNIYLSAYDGTTLAATSAIRVWVGEGAAPVAPVPLPAGLPLLGAGIGGLALLRRKRA